jgi:hypothetical protein
MHSINNVLLIIRFMNKIDKKWLDFFFISAISYIFGAYFINEQFIFYLDRIITVKKRIS